MRASPSCQYDKPERRERGGAVAGRRKEKEGASKKCTPNVYVPRVTGVRAINGCHSGAPAPSSGDVSGRSVGKSYRVGDSIRKFFGAKRGARVGSPADIHDPTANRYLKGAWEKSEVETVTASLHIWVSSVKARLCRNSMVRCLTALCSDALRSHQERRASVMCNYILSRDATAQYLPFQAITFSDSLICQRIGGTGADMGAG